MRTILLLAGLILANILSAQPVKLQCEHLDSPLGVDTPAPRLGWMPAEGSAAQAAYRIVVSTSPDPAKGEIWDSGKVSSEDIRTVYKGAALKPRTKYYWQVTVWDAAGESKTSAVADFETGLMDQHSWRGHWISDSHDVNIKPAAMFRKEFDATKKVVSARAYIAVGGLYELYVNGRKIGDHRLDPLYTRFDRRTLYLTHDITEQLQQGRNAVGVLLGNGWYNHQPTAVWWFDMAPWRSRPRFCMDVYVKYEDGTEQVIPTDMSWRTATGPVVFNGIYVGEHYDARLEQPGWNKPGFEGRRWRNAVNFSAPSQNIVSQQARPIRDCERIAAVKCTRFSPTRYIFDLGRNIAGVSQITFAGEKGTTLKLIHAEKLHKDGATLDMSNIDPFYRPADDSAPFQGDIFILKGEGEESFRARFNYKGFRYVQVEADRPVELTADNLHGWFMHSDVPAVGSVNSSDTLINKLWAATNASYLSNLFGYPTDCPQREKNGWTGDAHIAIETALYNFDGITVYEKWLADHQDAQEANGTLPAIIPSNGWGLEWGNGLDWTSTIAIIPWNIYLFYGDSRLLDNVYDNIKRYVDYVDRNYPSGITDWGLGDWVPIKTQSDKRLTSSIYYYVDAGILAKAAKIFGRTADYERYSALAEKIRKAINTELFNAETGIYCSGTQTELSSALYWGVVPEEYKAKVVSNLVNRIKTDGGLDIGLLGSKTLLGALSSNGYATLAYQLVSRDTYPSWGWWIRNGATTLYENWNMDASSEVSFNHIMFGEIGAWYYKALGGILPDPQKPGFKHIILKPNFVTGLQQFTASHISPYGKIVSSWERKGRRVVYNVMIPSGCSATLSVAGMDNKTLAAGKHTFTLTSPAGM